MNDFSTELTNASNEFKKFKLYFSIEENGIKKFVHIKTGLEIIFDFNKNQIVLYYDNTHHYTISAPKALKKLLLLNKVENKLYLENIQKMFPEDLDDIDKEELNQETTNINYTM